MAKEKNKGLGLKESKLWWFASYSADLTLFDYESTIFEIYNQNILKKKKNLQLDYYDSLSCFWQD